MGSFSFAASTPTLGKKKPPLDEGDYSPAGIARRSAAPSPHPTTFDQPRTLTLGGTPPAAPAPAAPAIPSVSAPTATATTGVDPDKQRAMEEAAAKHTRAGRTQMARERDYARTMPGAVGAVSGGTGKTPTDIWRDKMFPGTGAGGTGMAAPAGIANPPPVGNNAPQTTTTVAGPGAASALLAKTASLTPQPGGTVAGDRAMGRQSAAANAAFYSPSGTSTTRTPETPGAGAAAPFRGSSAAEIAQFHAGAAPGMLSRENLGGGAVGSSIASPYGKAVAVATPPGMTPAKRDVKIADETGDRTKEFAQTAPTKPAPMTLAKASPVAAPTTFAAPPPAPASAEELPKKPKAQRGG